MNWQEYPFFRLLIPLNTGILLSYFNLINIEITLIFYSIIFFTLMVLIFVSLKKFRIKNIYFQGISMQMILIFFGVFLEQHHHPYFRDDYFAKYLNSSKAFIVQVSEPPQSTEKTILLQVENLVAIDGQKKRNVCGKANFLLLKDKLSLSLKFKDVLLVENRYKELEIPGNPFQFDYKQYCFNKGVQYQQFISAKHFTILHKASGNTFMEWIYSSQRKLLNVLNQYIKNEDSRSVSLALILGYRSDISDELQKAYSGAGAIHVLAVSGLHVGIIYMILENILLLLPFFKSSRTGRALILLIIIWLFALLTGLPASVARAAVMFTFVIVGKSLKRPTNIFNSISVSAFFLLVYNPFLLFDVGFQLSYVAVFSIVTIQPFFQKFWTPKNQIVLYFWSILTVTMAAQIGTLPITLFYFKQFPVLFVFSNFIVIPASFVAMLLGMSLFAFSFIPVIAQFLGQLMDSVLWLMNTSIVFIESLSFSVIREIPFSFFQFIFLSLMLIFLFVFLINKKKIALFYCLGISLIFSFSILYEKILASQFEEFIVFSCKKQSLICISNPVQSTYIADSSLLKSLDSVAFQIQSHKIMRRIHNASTISLFDSVYTKNTGFKKYAEFVMWKNRIIVIAPEWVSGFKKPMVSDYLVVFKSNKSKPDKVYSIYKPKLVVLAANLSVYKRNQWKEYLIKNNLAFYDIAEKGAFILN